MVDYINNLPTIKFCADLFPFPEMSFCKKKFKSIVLKVKKKD